LKITLFFSDEIERITLEPISKAALDRGHEVFWATDFSQSAEVGLTCASRRQLLNARISAISLHGLDQGRWSSPDFWADEDWSVFDIGFIPGPEWQRRWEGANLNPGAHPRIGVFVNGWPKSDVSLNNPSGSRAALSELESRLNLTPGKRVLYAPGFETDDKQLDVMLATQSLDCALLVKHWPVPDSTEFADIRNNINRMNIEAKRFRNVVMLDPGIGIFDAIELADIVITDESTVSLEAVICNKPVISVQDWPMRVNNSDKARLASIPGHVKLIVARTELESAISQALETPSEFPQVSTDEVSHQGTASDRTIDVLEGIFQGADAASLDALKTLSRPSKIMYVILMVFPARVKLALRQAFARG